MDVFLVPIGRGRHALYCEPGEDAHAHAPGEQAHVHPPGAKPGLWRRISDWFAAAIAAVEREHDARSRPGAARPRGFWSRLRATVMGWMAEKIAEQRLLWRLRGRSHVRTLIPTGLDPERAMAIVRGNLVREFDRHRLWMVVDGLGALVGLALTPIPGPNLLGYYFTFRVVGHFFALRGARHGLSEVRWDLESSEPLSDLSALDGLSADERRRRVHAVAERLGLPRFARFYERAGSWSA